MATKAWRSATSTSGSGNSGIATCNISTLPVGAHSIVATYSGDAGNTGSSSAPLSQIVNAVLPSSLVNASFETPLQRGAFTYNPTGTGIGWTFSPNSGIAGNGSQFGAATAPEGVQVGFVQGASAISQTLSLNAGSHTLSFMASARYAHAQPLKVMLDGFQIGALVAPTSTAWALFSIPFSVATSGTHALAFVGTQAVNKTTFIDAVAIQ